MTDLEVEYHNYAPWHTSSGITGNAGVQIDASKLLQLICEEVERLKKEVRELKAVKK
jgi:hypothetical protein